MPGRFLTDAERARLGRYPADVPVEDLIAHFTLTTTDLAQVRERRGDANKLGFGLRLGALRAFGFCPDDMSAAPPTLVRFVADQLGLPPEALAGYGERAQTRTDHVREIQQHLYAARIVRPGVTRLERLVVATRRHADYVTHQRLRPLLTDERQAMLDGLLLVDAATGRTPLAWLRPGRLAKLAERSQGETKAIGELIAQVQAGTTGAVTAIERGVAQVEAGASRADQAGEALGEILDAARDTAGQIAGVAATSEELSAQVEATAAQAEALAATAEQLQALVARFRLTPDGAAEGRQPAALRRVA